MENKSIKTINTVGKVGRILSMILIVFMILAGVATLAGTIFAATLPKDDINITVNGTADITSDGDLFTQFKKAIDIAEKDGEIEANIVGAADGITIAGVDNEFFKNALIKDTEKGYSVDFNANTVTLSLGRVIYGLVATLLSIICTVVLLFMVRALMKSLEKCETPFCAPVITNMKRFGFSLIPFVVLRGITDSAWGSIFSKSIDFDMNLDLTVVFGILIVFMLAMIFSYGAELQKQSDETL